MKTIDNKSNTPNTLAIQLESHPPERKSRSVVVGGVCCSTCCCCCCCLHSVGGLIGSAIISGVALKSKPQLPFSTAQNQAMSPYQKQAYPVAQNYPAPQAYPINYDNIIQDYKSSTRTAVGLYWLLVLPTLGIAALLGEVSLILAAVLLPAIQIAIGLVMLILVNILPMADRSAATKAIAKILAGTFVGAILGVIVLGILSVLFVFK